MKNNVSLTLLGTGEAFSSEFGNTSFYGTSNQNSFLIDCGYQIPERLFKHDLHTKLDFIFFTHFHADHALGIGPLLGKLRFSNRKDPLTLVGPKGLKKYVSQVVQLSYPGLLNKIPFPIVFQEISKQVQFEKLDMTLTPIRSNHKVFNQGYHFKNSECSFFISGDGLPNDFSFIAPNTIHFQEVYTADEIINGHVSLYEFKNILLNHPLNTFIITHMRDDQSQKISEAVLHLKNCQIGRVGQTFNF